MSGGKFVSLAHLFNFDSEFNVVNGMMRVAA